MLCFIKRFVEFFSHCPSVHTRAQLIVVIIIRYSLRDTIDTIFLHVNAIDSYCNSRQPCRLGRLCHEFDMQSAHLLVRASSCFFSDSRGSSCHFDLADQLRTHSIKCTPTAVRTSLLLILGCRHPPRSSSYWAFELRT